MTAVSAAGRAEPPPAFPSPYNIAITDREFDLLRNLIARETGISLRDAKRSLVSSRLGRRLRALGLDNFAAYYEHVTLRDPGGLELRNMINAITTNKTSFFREARHFEILREAAQSWNSGIRIWSAACSTGEEPYTIAFALLDALGWARAPEISIVATDIDTEVLARAERGVYRAADVSSLTLAQKRAYLMRGFGEHEGYVQVRPEVRSLVKFRRLNLIAEHWPVHQQFDAVFCRNVMIYFDTGTQRGVFSRLVQHVRPGGMLFVGHSENLFWMGKTLTAVDHAAYRVRRQRHAET